MNYGIVIAKDGYDINSDTTKFDTDKSRLQVDVTHRPKHLDIIKLKNVGTAFVDNSTNIQKETLFEVLHGYRFIPFCFAYFFVTQAPTVDALYVGNYANTQYIINNGDYLDYIQMEVDNGYFRIVHVFQGYGGSTGATSTIGQYKFQIKYYISSLIDGKLNA